MFGSPLNPSNPNSPRTRLGQSRVQANPIAVNKQGAPAQPQQEAPVQPLVQVPQQTDPNPAAQPARRLLVGDTPPPAAPAPSLSRKLNVGVPAQPPLQQAQPQLQQAQPAAPRLLVGGVQAAPVAQQQVQQAAPQMQQPMDIASIDAELTSVGAIPYYSLTQTVENLRSFRERNINFRASSTPSAQAPEVQHDAYEAPAAKEVTQEVTHTQGDARYINERKIGEGGTSTVFRATDVRLNRDVALKRFNNTSRTDKNADYLLELEAASKIHHPYVVTAIDADVDQKSRYIVMELIEGVDMETAIAKRGLSFDINRFTEFAIQVLEGLHATHKAGLLHLDLKPANIMICDQGGGRDVVKIIDFGRARPIKNEEGRSPKGRGLNGSIFYCAPEQVMNKELDVRTDLYALGCVFYWTLANKRPFDGRNPIAIMAAHMQHLVADLSEEVPGIPEWLSNWVMSLIAQEKEDRPQTAREAIDALTGALSSDKVAQLRA